MRGFLVGVLLGLGALSSFGCDEPGDETEGEGGSGAGGNAEGGGNAATTVATTGSGEPRVCDGFATEVVETTYGAGAGFGQDGMPGVVLGPPTGMGDLAGSLDVVTLGNGGIITLAFGGKIVDEPGPDFIVFENVFYAGGDPSAPYAEIGAVEISADGETWIPFPCTATELPFEGCAGWHPTYAGSDPSIDAHDPERAGGDAFDLADVGLTEARFVRVTDRVDLGGFSGAFDLDAVALVNWVCDPS
jgi:hypothetical protein